MVTHKVLFVDDEPTILSLLEKLFSNYEDLEIYTAPSGKEGLKIFRQTAIDLVVSDHVMDGMDGTEFLAIVKEKYPNTIRVILTGYADTQSAIEAVNKGEIYRYLTKPWDDKELKLTINKALELYRIQQENREMFELIQKQNMELEELNLILKQKVKKRTAELENAEREAGAAKKALAQFLLNMTPESPTLSNALMIPEKLVEGVIIKFDKETVEIGKSISLWQLAIQLKKRNINVNVSILQPRKKG